MPADGSTGVDEDDGCIGEVELPTRLVRPSSAAATYAGSGWAMHRSDGWARQPSPRRPKSGKGHGRWNEGSRDVDSLGIGATADVSSIPDYAAAPGRAR